MSSLEKLNVVFLICINLLSVLPDSGFMAFYSCLFNVCTAYLDFYNANQKVQVMIESNLSSGMVNLMFVFL